MYRIYLTVKEENILKAVFPIAKEVNKKISKDFSKQELITLKENLFKMCNSIKELLKE